MFLWVRAVIQASATCRLLEWKIMQTFSHKLGKKFNGLKHDLLDVLAVPIPLKLTSLGANKPI